MALEANRCSDCWRSLPRLENDQLPNFCPHCQFPLKPVAGLYQLESRIGAGAFGTVYRSRHLENGTTHAVKIMRWDLVEEMAPDYWGKKQKMNKQREFEQRFQREVDLTTVLANESWHIVQIDDAGSDPVHGLYYVMELLEGASLHQFVKQWPAMSRRSAFSIMEQVCLAIGAAHKRDVIHRDLKPENVIILQEEDRGRFVKVLDFGIAKVLSDKEVNLTSRPLGTPLYMAPEQCVNGAVDQRTDIYALGCLFYHVFTGEPPFESHLEITQLIMNHVQSIPPTLRERCPQLQIPIGLERAVMKALAKSPGDRYESVDEFWAAIQPYSQWQEEDSSRLRFTHSNVVIPAEALDHREVADGQTLDETGEPDWSLGGDAWESFDGTSGYDDDLWEARQFQRGRLGWRGFLVVAVLLLGIGWAGSRSGLLSLGQQSLVKHTKQKQLSKEGLYQSKRGNVRSANEAQFPAPKRRLSRLERFLQKQRKKKKKRAKREARKTKRAQARRRKKKKQVRRSKKVVARVTPRPKGRVSAPRPRPVKRASAPRPRPVKRVVKGFRVATVALKQQASWPKAQRVRISPGRILTNSNNASTKASVGRTLSISRGFWMWRTEVTQGQFQALMGYNPSHFNRCGKRCPVENVTWHEAAAFCNALSRQQNRPQCFECTGKGRNVWCMVKRSYWSKQYYQCKGWRLPTESEWEYAYRAGSPAPYYSGKCLLPGQANYNGKRTVGDCPKSRYRNRTTPVASFRPNAWGMYDMAGNVWEWVYDSYRSSLPSGRNAVRIGSSRRVVRGGGWYSSARECSATARESFSAAKRGIILGFRPTRSR